MSKSLYLNASDDYHDLLKLIAVKEDCSVSQLAMRAIDEYCRIRGYYDIQDEIDLTEHLTLMNVQ